MEAAEIQDEIGRLASAIAALEAQRDALGDDVVDTTINALRERLESLHLRTAPQRKQVTVLAADLSGFTAMSERLDPEVVRDTIDQLWHDLDEIIISWGGRIDQHTGDGIMAFFGIPVAHEDDPERAVAAGLTMLEKLREVNDRGDHPQLALRIGVHTGHVLLAPRKHGDAPAAMGETVSVAARLEQQAPIGGVLISQEVHRNVADHFVVAPAAPDEGISGLPTFLVLNRGRAEGGRQQPDDARSLPPMIGRDEPLRLLNQWLAEAVAGRQCRAVTVVGDPGIGKTRLGQEFCRRLGSEAGHGDALMLLEARAELPLQQLPYVLFRELFRQYAAIGEGDPSALAQEKLEHKMRDLLTPELDEAEATTCARLVGQLVGFDFRLSQQTNQAPEDARQLRERSFAYATRFFQALASRGPLVLLVEDLHWADEGSIDLVWRLINDVQDVPFFILMFTRPSLLERRPGWRELVRPGSLHTILTLEPLARPDSEELAARMLGDAPHQAPGLVQTIVEAAGGNPYYVEEIVKVLLEDRAVTQNGTNRARAVQPAALRIPTTLTGVLQTRLDRLAPDERDVLQRASVVGRVFWREAVAATGRPFLKPLADTLRQLEARELIFRRPYTTFTGVAEYSFKHAILREVTYESLLVRQRSAYHGAVAQWLAERGDERVQEYAGLIGSHYEQAGETAVAAHWYGQAADQARAAYTPETAIHYYRKALEFTPDVEGTLAERVRLYEGLGDTLRWQARFGEAVGVLQKMLRLAEKIGDIQAQVRAWRALFLAHDYQGEHRAAMESATGAERIARQTGSPADLAMALSAKGWALLFLGEEEQALRLGEEARQLSEQGGFTRELAYSYMLIGGVLRMTQQYERGAAAIERALALFRESGDRIFEGSMLFNLGQTRRLQGDYEAAAAYYAEALELARAVGDHYGAMSALSRMGRMARLQGAYRQAGHYLREALLLAEKSGNLGRQAHLAYSLGDLALAQALESGTEARDTLLAEAESALERAHNQAAESGQAVTEAAAKVGLARLHFVRGDLEAARLLALAGLEAARLQVALWQGIAAEKVSGTAWWVLGQIASHLPPQSPPLVIEDEEYDAAACYAASMAVWEHVGGGVIWERARTLRDWSALLLQQGDAARGEAMRQEATALFARLGMVHEIDRVASPDRPAA